MSRLVTLPRSELTQLQVYEAKIERGMATFIEVGAALSAIRDAKLYRADFATFEDYCTARWGFVRRTANRYIEAAEAAEVLGPMGPISERQVRPLTRLPRDEQSAAWERAQEIAQDEGTPVRSRHVEQAVREIKPRSNGRRVDVDAPPTASALIANWQEQLVQITDAVADTMEHLGAMPASVAKSVWKEAAEPMIHELRKLQS